MTRSVRESTGASVVEPVEVGCGRGGGRAGDREDPAGTTPFAGQPDGGRRGGAVVPAGDAVRGDPQELEAGGGRGAEDRKPRGPRRDRGVARFAAGGAGAAGGAVQQEVEPGAGEPGEGVRVPQRAGSTGGVGVVAGGGERVAYGSDPQPALLLVSAQGLGEPGGLVAADGAVLVVGAVAEGHGGVEPGDHGAEFGDREQGPGLVAVEDGVQPVIEAAEEPGVVAPLGPVRGLRGDLVRLTGVEVAAAGGLVHVLRAGHHHDPLRRQVEL